MTHDEMIEATARVLDKTLAFEIESDVRANEMTHEERCKLARAALRVIAPAVLEEAARIAPAKIRAEGCETVGQWERRALREAIRAMKTRYE